MSSANSGDQDWTVVVFRKKKTAATGAPKNNNASGPAQEETITLKKTTGGTNKRTTKKAESSHLRKVDQTEIDKIPRVSLRVRQAISKARTAKGISQKDLA